eukprot:UN26538
MDMSTTKAQFVEFNGARSEFADDLHPAPTTMSLRHPGRIELQTEFIGAPLRYDPKKPEKVSPFYDSSGPLPHEVNVTPQIPAKLIRKQSEKKVSSQKWAVSQRFVKFICSDWGGRKFNSGYCIYADDFQENTDIE